MKHPFSFSALIISTGRSAALRFVKLLAGAYVVSTLGAGAAVAGDTAYDALRVACAKAGKDAQSRIVLISGTSGKPQPAVWRVVLEEGGAKAATQEYDVQRDKVVGIRRASASFPPGSRLNLASIQLDSDGVFTIANNEALRANVSFDRLDYVLSTGSPGGSPAWKVELFDGPSVRVGLLRIAADTGVIIERSRELTVTEEEKREARWSKPGQPYRSVPDFFHRAWKSTEKTGYKLKNWANGYGWTAERDPAPPEN
ncbi:MAG: hypothetical protein EBS01_04595 [Verrucomicrobia bacterium]|nr:hypothetical protein [Verrucomicrobiota bacterium]